MTKENLILKLFERKVGIEPLKLLYCERKQVSSEVLNKINEVINRIHEVFGINEKEIERLIKVHICGEVARGKEERIEKVEEKVSQTLDATTSSKSQTLIVKSTYGDDRYVEYAKNFIDKLRVIGHIRNVIKDVCGLDVNIAKSIAKCLMQKVEVDEYDFESCFKGYEELLKNISIQLLVKRLKSM